jgi:DASH complex subunit DAD2
MAYNPPRPGSSSLGNRPSASQQSTQASALQTRIQEKKSELESLKQLRDLSAGLAGQMQQLEEKKGPKVEVRQRKEL